MINYGVYYHDQLDHETKLFCGSSIVKAMEFFTETINTRDIYDEGVELCFVDEEGLYLDTIYYEEYPKCLNT